MPGTQLARMVKCLRWSGLLVALLVLPEVSEAQNSAITGVVRDASGAVLPGVSVTISSPALIERVRETVTDDQGQYRVVDLRPGVYSVNFTLSGFSNVEHAGIELTSGFTATINGVMRIGTIEESVTVSGASPVVDVQNIVSQTIFSSKVLEALPTNKNLIGFTALTPGASYSAASFHDVGGLAVKENDTSGIHGGRDSDMMRMIDGMTWNVPTSGGLSGTQFATNASAAQEVNFTLGGGSAEYQTGGIVMNLIPKEGGNTFASYFFTKYGNGSMQSDNLSDELRGRGMRTIDQAHKVWDVTGTFGGPIVKNRLWFFTTYRHWGRHLQLADAFLNSNPESWVYTPDFNRPYIDKVLHADHQLRVTWALTSKQKVSFLYNGQRDKVPSFGGSGRTLAVESLPEGDQQPQRVWQGTWKMPASNKLLLEAGATYVQADWLAYPVDTRAIGLISARELSTGFTYRSTRDAPGATRSTGPKWSYQTNQRLALSYVTGAHNLKVGLQTMQGGMTNQSEMYGDMNYNFLNGVPNQVVMYTTPYTQRERLKMLLGLYAQDQWTLGRATVNYGLRFDYLNALVPPQHADAARFVDERNFSEVPCVPCWKDLSPRVGVAYDLFGDGKTAVKTNLGRYPLTQALGLARAVNPFATSVNNATRPWTDLNRDFIPQGDFRNPDGNGELGPISNRNFGRLVPSTIYEDEVLKGWHVRPYHWQFSTSVQRELMSGVSVNVAYYRTWFGNFDATHNTAVTPADFDAYSIQVPANPRLPGGGGYTLSGLYNITPAKNGLVNNRVVKAKTFGKQSEIYNGADVTLNARFGDGQISGGLSTGQTVTDVCDILNNYPNVSLGSITSSGNSPTAECRTTPPWSALTQIKFNGMYALPWDMRISATYQNVAPPATNATGPVPNSAIAPSLGRNLAACGTAVVCNQTVSVPFYAPGTRFFEKRLTQVDLRFSKSFRIQHARVEGNVDLYNAFNANSVVGVNGTYGPEWGNPLQAIPGRILQLGFQVYF